jgi:peptidoglycan hydrolase-like protein with peptidoglycan-binding domain
MTRLRSKPLLVTTGLVVAGGAAAVAILAGSTGTGSASGGHATGATATIERRDLVQTDDQPGTLGYRDSRVAYSALGGTVTWLPRLGAVVRPDHRLLSLDGKPVVLMPGLVPMYRALSTGVSDGADVRELETDLVALGYDPGGAITVDDHYSSTTAAAVNRWKKAHGLTQNGRVEPGRIVFLPGPRRVTTLDVRIGQALPPGMGAPVMGTTGDRQVATVQLDAAQQTEARVGEHVDVTLPSERVVRGVITNVGRVAQSSGPSGGDSGGNSTSGPGPAPGATVPITIELHHARRLPPLDQAPVTVALAQSIERHVLSVPVSALLATAGGHYAVDVVNAAGTTTRMRVTPGAFAGGYVEIAGPGISAGLHVVDTAEQ